MNKHELRAAVAIAFIALLIVQAQPSGLPNFPNARAASRSIFLSGVLSGWNVTDPLISVTQGDDITMTVSSADTADHRFVIDVDGSGLDASPSCPPDKCSNILFPSSPPDTFSFNVDFAPGNYTYYCTFHTSSMQGIWRVRGFTISSSPSSLRIFRGSSDTSIISVTSVNGFTGTVSLSAAVSPSGPTPSIDSTVTVSPGSPGTATLTVSTTDTQPTGSYVVRVSGVSDSSSSTLDVAASIVEDFSINTDPTTLMIPLGSSKSSTITLGSLGQFSGSVDLSTSSPPSGTTVMFNPNPVPLPAGGTATSTMDVTASMSATPGTYIIDVIGTSGTLQHTAPVMLVVGQDFGISPNPATLSIVPTQSGTSTITMTSFNSFSGTVDLSVTGSPSGLALSINPPSVTVPPDGTVAAVLNGTALATTEVGNYT